MCDASAAVTSAAHCTAHTPFTKSFCLGGCCFSSGKCTSSSCAIAGMGKEVPSTICYGLNPAGQAGASARCEGLACKLATPGCLSDLLGGSCVGTVVDLKGNSFLTNPAGAAMVGYPCLDVTASTKTVAADGSASTGGAYMASLWSVCDCYAAPTLSESMAGTTTTSTTGTTSSSSTTTPTSSTGTPASTGTGITAATTGLLATIGKLNVTDLVTLVNTVQDIADHPMQSALSAAAHKIGDLIVPDLPAANVTSAIAFLGSLVGGGSRSSGATSAAAATPVGTMLSLLRGASALAAATKSNNPLGSLLGAFASKTAANATQPLAGLRNLVSALAGSGADTTEKADVLSALLSALSGGSGSSPAAEVLGIVTKLMGASNTPGVKQLRTLIRSFTTPTNGTDGLLQAFSTAVSEGKAAASGEVDLPGVFAKLLAFAGRNSSIGATSSSATRPSTTAASFMTPASSSSSAGGNKFLSLLRTIAAVTTSSVPTNTTSTATPSTSTSTTASAIKFLINTLNMGTKNATTSSTTGSSTATTGTSTSTTGTTSSGSTTPSSGTSTFTASTASTANATSSGSTGSGVTLKGILDAATKVAPVIQALAGNTQSTATSDGSTLALLGNVMSAMSGAGSGASGGGSLADVASLVSKVTPLLQALGGGAGGAATTSASTLQSIAQAFGLGGSSASNASSGAGLSLGDVLQVANDVAPVLSALSSMTGGSSSSLVSGIQAFLNTLSG